MKIINTFKYISILISGLLAPLLIILVPFSLSFVLLAYALHQFSKGTHLKPVANIIFIMLTILINIICAWYWVKLDQGFGNDTTIAGEF